MDGWVGCFSLLPVLYTNESPHTPSDQTLLVHPGVGGYSVRSEASCSPTGQTQEGWVGGWTYRCSVPTCHDVFSQVGRFLFSYWTDAPRKAKIADFEVAVGVEEDVGGLFMGKVGGWVGGWVDRSYAFS